MRHLGGRMMVVAVLCATSVPVQAWGRPIVASAVVDGDPRPKLPACTVTDDNSRELGSFRTEAEAVVAARGANLQLGHFVQASINGERVVIARDGRVYEDIACSGIGQREPQDVGKK